MSALNALSTGSGGTILLDGNGGLYDVTVDQGGQGAATQSILMQAEAFSMAGHPLQGVYNQDIKVFDNMIYNGQYHGISVAQADGAQIYNNTVLWNTDAQMVGGRDCPTVRLRRVGV